MILILAGIACTPKDQDTPGPEGPAVETPSGDDNVETPAGDTGEETPQAEEHDAKPPVEVDEEQVSKLVDLEGFLADIDEQGPSLIEGMKQEMGSGAMPDEPISLAQELGLSQSGLETSIEGDMINAHGEYTFEAEDAPRLTAMAEAGPAEIVLPARFSEDIYSGHFFMARPGEIIENLITAADEALQEEMGGQADEYGMTMNLDFVLNMYGIMDRDSLYGWMGDELVIFSLLNEDYTESDELDYGNSPFQFCLAIASDEPEEGIELFKSVLNSMVFQMMGMSTEDTEFEGYTALRIPPMDIENSQFAQMMPPEQLEKMADLPPGMMVAVPGYLLITTEPSMGTVIEAFSPGSRGTGRTASMEAQINWDHLVTNMDPSNPIAAEQMADYPTLMELMEKIHEETRDLDYDPGMSRMTINVTDPVSFTMDILTSAGSIALMEEMDVLFDEIPSEMWEQIGNEFGQAANQQAMMGGSPSAPDDSAF